MHIIIDILNNKLSPNIKIECVFLLVSYFTLQKQEMIL